MAFSSILCRSALQVLPLAIGAVVKGTTTTALFSFLRLITAISLACSFKVHFHRHLTTLPSAPVLMSLSFESLNQRSNAPKSLKATIKPLGFIPTRWHMCFVEKLHHTCGLFILFLWVEDAPEGFPFKIQDTPGQQTISLSRGYQGETIDVEVHMPDENDENDDEDDDEGSDENDGKDDDEDDTERGSIQLDVKVSKKGGLCLEFSCTAFLDEVEIDSLSIKDPNAEDQITYEGPDFFDLDENLQKAFHKYLETRGIKPSTTNFSHEYMIKDSREYLMWLKNLKKFIEA